MDDAESVNRSPEELFREAVVDLIVIATDELISHRDDAYPQEAVGILCDDGTTYRLINQARSGTRFEVSKLLVTESIKIIKRQNRSAIGIYHSHPTSQSAPSSRDIDMMRTQPGNLFVIVGNDVISGWAWRGDFRQGDLISLGEVGITDKIVNRPLQIVNRPLQAADTNV